MIKQNGAEELRVAVRMLGSVDESLLDRYSTAELLQLVRMWRASKWDIPPDRWTLRQLREATRKRSPVAPHWQEDDKGLLWPVYGK